MNIRGQELQTKQSAFSTAVQQLAGRFDWGLLSEDDWSDQAANVCMTTPDMEPFEACLNVYARALYDACRNGQDASRQAQAYTELHHYLFQKACRRCPANLVEEAAQTALELVFEKIGTCRNPGAFLAFAGNWLLAAIKLESGAHPPGAAPDPGDDDVWADDAWAADEFADLLADLQMGDDLKDCIAEIQRRRPRARNQLNAFLWKYFDGFSDQEIAAFLHTTVGHVYVLCHRAKEKLRKCLARRGYPASSPNGKV